jgi:RimJ/RimL family protein N-acetyltransferase
MITIERTTDYAMIRRIVTHPRIYPWITDDGSPGSDEWEPIRDDRVWYLLVKLEGQPAGVFIFLPQNSICYEMHTCLMPLLWGQNHGSVLAGMMAVQWMFENSSAQRIVGNAADYNRLALRYGRKIGLKQFGTNPKSFLHDGTLYDQHLLGVSKEEVCH